jgi:hypothetical protein
MIQQNITPSLKQSIPDVQVVLSDVKENKLVGVDLLDGKTRDLGPSSIRIVSILQIL